MEPQDARPSRTGQHLQFVAFAAWEQLLSTSLFSSLKISLVLDLVFSLSIFLIQSLLTREGPGLSSVAELRFRTSGGMVEPLIHRKEKGDWALRKGTHLGSVRHKFSLPLASLRCLHTQTMHKGLVVYWRYLPGSTIPQEFKLYVQTSLGIHMMTADIKNPDFMKSSFKAIYLMLLLPYWTPERQISIRSRVIQIKWNAQHPSEGSKNTQGIANFGAQTTNVWYVVDAARCCIHSALPMVCHD